MVNGIVNVYKEAGYTSHDVVARLRGITHQKKIGHTGTLDPEAVGVLCVCLGAATKVCDMLTDETKQYRAIMLLGIETDTQDTTGSILSESEVDVTPEQVREVIGHFVGEISQVPPMYSALKVGGKKLYELARAGIEVERKARKITIYDMEIEEINLPRVTIRVTCSKGTYIRTLCNDIGASLGCGAAMEHLTRTRVGDFCVEDSIKLDELELMMKENRFEEALVTPRQLFAHLPVAIVNSNGERLADNGNYVSLDDIEDIYTIDSQDTADNHDAVDNHDTVDSREIKKNVSLHNNDEIVLLKPNGFFYGVYQFIEDRHTFKPVKMFFCE